MSSLENNKYNLSDPDKQDELSLFVDIIHNFTTSVTKAKSEEEVYWIITKELVPNLNLVDCVVYKVNSISKTLEQVAAFGDKNKSAYKIDNKLTLGFGEGHAGIAAEKGASVLIKDCTKSKDYIKDLFDAKSEIEVPMKIGDQTIAVISSEHPEKNFYSTFHIKLFEVVASIAVGTLIRIFEKEELEAVKDRLESIVERKTTDLDRVIDTISDQYVELKHQNKKQEELIQEVHHRVNNNLQVISSLIKLYLPNSKNGEFVALKSLSNRIQTMALIHQNMYKSFEMNHVDLNSYVRDLMDHLKSQNNQVYVTFDIQSNVEHISLSILVPFGLFITELMAEWIKDFEEHNLKNVNLTLQFDKNQSNTLRLKIIDNMTVDLSKSRTYDDNKNVSHILISALKEQLGAKTNITFDKNNCCELLFSLEDH